MLDAARRGIARAFAGTPALLGGGTLINRTPAWLDEYRRQLRAARRPVPVFSPGVAHPEYWALVDGKRSGPQFEVGNPVLRKLVIDWEVDFFKQNPTADMVSVELMQRVWANLFYNETEAGNTFQQTLDAVADWLAGNNALPAPTTPTQETET